MTSKRTTLKAVKRTVIGKKVSTLRRLGLIPAHIFGNNVELANIQVDAKIFGKIYKEAGETALVDLQVEGESVARPVLIVNVDRDVVVNTIKHIDFHQVNLKENVTANIPVETVGESEAVKNGAVLVVSYNELEVEALPTDLPEKFELDLTKLNSIEDTITVADLSYDREKITVTVEQDEVLASLQAQLAEEVLETETIEPGEVEITKGGPTTEEGKEAATSAPAKDAPKTK